MWRMTYLPRYMSMYVNDNQDTACWSTCLQMNRWAQHRASPDRSARRQSVCPTPNMRPDPPCNGARTTSNEREKTLDKLHTSIQRNRRKQRDWCHTHRYLKDTPVSPDMLYTIYKHTRDQEPKRVDTSSPIPRNATPDLAANRVLAAPTTAPHSTTDHTAAR